MASKTSASFDKFTLRAADLSDARPFADISRASFGKDTHTQMKLAAGHDPLPLDGMTRGIEGYIQNARMEVTKAVDEQGKPLGWIGWARKGFEDQAVTDITDAGQEEKHSAFRRAHRDDDDTEDPVMALESITNADMRSWQARITRQFKKHLFIVGISIDPASQGKGVGSALLRTLTDYADREGVICWVHSSEAGQFLFAKNGFQKRESLEVDLDEFARGTSAENKGPEGGKWGEYVFRYMVRDPKGSKGQE